MTTKHIWSQRDRETPMEQTRRDVVTAVAALRHLRAVFEESLEGLYRHQDPSALFARALQPLSEQLNATTTLVEAYDYYLARCAEAGLTPERATAAWEAQTSPAWEAEVVEAEAYGPNALPMVDAQILAALGLPPHEDKAEAAD
jgi:hypothetical protein